MVQSATLMAKIVAAPYTVAYVTNQTDVAADRSEGVIAIPAELPPLSKPGYVFLGWYMDNKTFADPAVPGAYITADLAGEEERTVTLYAKWKELATISGSVYISWIYGEPPNAHTVGPAARVQKARVILQRTLEGASDGWNPVASEQVNFSNADDEETTYGTAEFSFTNVESTDDKGQDYLFRVVVTQPDYSSWYHTAEFKADTPKGTGKTEPAAGSYYVKLDFKPEDHILPYQIDARLLNKRVWSTIPILQAKFVYRTDFRPAEDTDLNKWPFVIAQHETSGLEISVGSETGYGGRNDDTNAALWFYQPDGKPYYFQIKLVDDQGNLLDPAGYSLQYSPALSWDRNTGRWIGGADYIGESEFLSKAATVTLVPDQYPVAFNLGYDAYPNELDQRLWKDSPWVSYTYGEGRDTLPNPARSYYSFDGWYTNPECTGTPVNSIAYNDTGAKIFYAKWTHTSNDVTLTYHANGGTEYQNERYSRNTVVELKKTPFREGYTFIGWFADEALSEKITSVKMTSNKTVYAGWRASTVPDMLNGTDHFAYVMGYSDGLIKPLDNISRAEVSTVFFRLLRDDTRNKALTGTNTFADVNEGLWYNTSVSTMAALGAVKGRSAETFDPNAPITRAEFAAICARFDTSVDHGNSSFTDIAGHWAEADIERAATLGWIRGYSDGTFRPQQYITRAEAMSIINRVLCRMPETSDDLLDTMIVWPDCHESDWYYLAVQEASNGHTYEQTGKVYERWTGLTESPDWSLYQ